MKKLICLLMTFLLVFSFLACKEKKENTQSTDKAKEQNLFSVLNSESPFITEKNTTVYLNEYKPFYKYEGETDFYETENVFVPREYTFVDLDKDGVNELIAYDDQGSMTYLILHQENDKIYGYSLYARWFLDLKQDGCFVASSGVSYSDFCTISFDKNTYKTTIIAKDYFVGDEDYSTFEIDGRYVDFEEIQKFREEWEKRPLAKWTEYSQTSDKIESFDYQVQNDDDQKVLIISDNENYSQTIVYASPINQTTKDYYFVDVNFDGVNELVLPTTGSAYGMWFEAYSWDNNIKQFVRFNSIDEMTNPVIDNENKQILHHFSGGQITSYAISKYNESGQLVNVASLYWEPAYLRGDTSEENKDKIYVCEEINGEEKSFYVQSNPNYELEPDFDCDEFKAYTAAGSYWDINSDKWEDYFFTYK